MGHHPHKFRLSIGKRLRLGFGFLLGVVLVTSYITYKTLNRNLKENNQITDVYSPSAKHLNDLLFTITNTKMLIKNWVWIEKQETTPDKQRLKQIHNERYPVLKQKLAMLVEKWDDQQDRKKYRQICKSIDTLFAQHKEIMSQLNSFESYEDPTILLVIIPRVEQSGDIIQRTDRILKGLSELVEKQQQIVYESNQRMKRSFAHFRKLVFILGIVLIFGVLGVSTISTRVIIRPLKDFKNIILSMGKGVLPEKHLKVTNDEIGEMSVAMNLLVDGLKKTSKFANEIGHGRLNAGFQPLSKEDTLGNALLEMRDSLKNAREEEERRKAEDEKRNWTAKGLAMFGEILRENTENIEEISQDTIKNLVHYLGAIQGGLFIYNDENQDDIYLELIAQKAYDSEKSRRMRIAIDEGLVGDCAVEKQTEYITNLPDNYIKVTSGLGEQSPKVLLLVPLLSENKIQGVIEIASFKEFETYKIEFAERIGYRIGARFASIKNTDRIRRLLGQSQEQTEELQAQEEEMRQNLEELRVTQEEMKKAQIELQKANRQLKKNEEELEQKVAERTAEIEKQKHDLENANEKILATNEQLETQKKELQRTLEDLKRTQSKLVQSEKMASLGQLIAGIAHEINTPLGAIKSSIGTISDTLNQSIFQLPELIRKLPDDRLKDFYRLIDKGLKDNKLYTSREERKLKRSLRRTLEDVEVEDADNIADTLIDMNIHEGIENFIPLLKDENIELILKVGYNILAQYRNSRNIETAIERASKVVFALKSYARYDHSETKVQANIVTGIETVLTLYHNQLKHGIEVIKDYEEVPEILCYPDELNQVWTNLIQNSIQAMKNKGQLKIRIFRNDANLAVQISDTGSGIDQEIQQKIFEPFFTTKPTGEGSGLGLDIVLKIIEKHNGKIDLDSQKGHGATFTVLLPIE